MAILKHFFYFVLFMGYFFQILCKFWLFFHFYCIMGYIRAIITTTKPNFFSIVVSPLSFKDMFLENILSCYLTSGIVPAAQPATSYAL